MTWLNLVTKITAHGTKKSERAGGLDNGEVSSFSINPGEYNRDLEDLEDLLSLINDSAYKRGEWISSILVGNKDMVKDIISDVLNDCMGNENDAITELSNIGMFMHADGDWLRSEVMIAKEDMRQ